MDDSSPLWSPAGTGAPPKAVIILPLPSPFSSVSSLSPPFYWGVVTNLTIACFIGHENFIQVFHINFSLTVHNPAPVALMLL